MAQDDQIHDLLVEVIRPTEALPGPSQPDSNEVIASGVLKGRLTLGSSPVAGARLTFGFPGKVSEGWTDKFGSYRIDGAGEASRVTVSVFSGEYSVVQYTLPAPVSIPASGLAHYDIALPEPAINVEGTITVEGCDSFSVFLKGICFTPDGASTYLHYVVPRGVNQYAFRNLPSGIIGIEATIWTDDRNNGLVEGISLRPDDIGDITRDLYFAPRSLVSGVVSGVASGDHVYVALASGEIPYETGSPRDFYLHLDEYLSTSLGEQQDFEFKDVKMGRYTLFVFTDTHEPPKFAHAIIDVAHGEPLVVDIELRER